MVARLPPRESLNTGKLETVDNVKVENKDYYDGSTRLRGSKGFLKGSDVSSATNY